MIFLVGNWKMAPEKHTEAIALAKKTITLARTYKTLRFISAVPAIHLSSLVKIKQKALLFAGQGVAAHDDIAQTGLVSAGMLASYGVSYCIVGHSESRGRGETDDMVAAQTRALLQKKRIPIICVGEKERDTHGWYLSSVKDQVEKVLKSIEKQQLKHMVFAYEPVWAIGKNAVRVATPLECREMIIFIRKIIADVFGEKEVQKVTILYGGSVDEHNAALFMKEGGAQGFLVGRVSLDTRRFGLLAKELSRIEL